LSCSIKEFAVNPVRDENYLFVFMKLLIQIDSGDTAWLEIRLPL
jgi:hypothetical protein